MMGGDKKPADKKSPKPPLSADEIAAIKARRRFMWQLGASTTAGLAGIATVGGIAIKQKNDAKEARVVNMFKRDMEHLRANPQLEKYEFPPKDELDSLTYGSQINGEAREVGDTLVIPFLDLSRVEGMGAAIKQAYKRRSIKKYRDMRAGDDYRTLEQERKGSCYIRVEGDKPIELSVGEEPNHFIDSLKDGNGNRIEIREVDHHGSREARKQTIKIYTHRCLEYPDAKFTIKPVATFGEVKDRETGKVKILPYPPSRFAVSLAVKNLEVDFSEWSKEALLYPKEDDRRTIKDDLQDYGLRPGIFNKEEGRKDYAYQLRDKTTLVFSKEQLRSMSRSELLGFTDGIVSQGFATYEYDIRFEGQGALEVEIRGSDIPPLSIPAQTAYADARYASMQWLWANAEKLGLDREADLAKPYARAFTGAIETNQGRASRFAEFLKRDPEQSRYWLERIQKEMVFGSKRTHLERLRDRFNKSLETQEPRFR